MLTRVQTANDKDVERLTNDYNQAVSRAKSDFDTKFNDLQHDFGLQLNAATANYGIGSEMLSKQLSDITAKYGSNALAISAKYIENMNSINRMANDQIKMANDLFEYNNKVENKRFDEYIANGGQILSNTTFATLSDDVKNGILSVKKARDLQALMQNSVQNTLAKLGSVNTDDINTINSLLRSGKTPSEVLAEMQTMQKFSVPSSQAALDIYAQAVAKDGISAIKDLPRDIQDKVINMYANMTPAQRLAASGKVPSEPEYVQAKITMTDADGNKIDQVILYNKANPAERFTLGGQPISPVEGGAV